MVRPQLTRALDRASAPFFIVKIHVRCPAQLPLTDTGAASYDCRAKSN